MSPLAAVFNIAIIVGIVGIVVYWVRRFAVFRGYKEIEPDVHKLAELLKTEPVRDASDIVLAGHCGRFPTIIRFSQRLDTPGLNIQMRVPATVNFTLMPRSVSLTGQGRVVLRTGSATLDKRFLLRTDQPTEMRMFGSSQAVLTSLEQLCCSTQSGLALKGRTLELSEMTIPPFTANHVFDHVESMHVLADRLGEMPGSDNVKIEPLPPQGSSWTIRIALASGLVCLVALLLAQPYNRPSIIAGSTNAARPSGVPSADAGRIQNLRGWHVAQADDFSEPAARFLERNRIPISGRLNADFAGRGEALDSAYLLINNQGQRRVSMLSGGMVVYDAIFPHLDFVARIPKASAGKIKWISAPKNGPDGDALLVVQNVENPSASLVLLRHGAQTYSAQPADFTEIDLGPR